MRRIFLIAVACTILSAAAVHARDVIIWYDDEGNEHSVTMNEPGPLEQKVLEDKISREHGIPSDALPDDPDARSAELQARYDDIKDGQNVEVRKKRLRAQLSKLEERGDAIDREMQKIDQAISYKRYRRNRIFSRNKNKRIHLNYEINQLENTPEQLAEMKKGVEVKQHALTTQLNAL